MARTLDEVIESLPLEQQREIEERTAHLIDEYKSGLDASILDSDKQLPFATKTPNAVTLEAMREVDVIARNRREYEYGKQVEPRQPGYWEGHLWGRGDNLASSSTMISNDCCRK